MATEQIRLIDLVDDVCAGKDVFFQSVRVAKDVMAKDVKTLSLEDTVGASLKFMKDNKVRHIPVIDSPNEKDQKPYFVGVVSERDVFRQISPYVGKIGQEDTDLKALREPLGKLVTRKPKFVLPQTPIPDMIGVMVDNHVDMVPVLTDGELVSIVTADDILKFFVRLDIIRRVCAEAGTEKTEGRKKRLVDLVSGGLPEMTATLVSVFQTVQDFMSEQVVYLQEQDTLAKAMETMQKGQFRHVPVVDEQSRLVGIVSDRDVLHHLRYLSYAERKRVSQAGAFRNHLFEVDPEDPSLKLGLGRVMATDVIYVSPSCGFYDVAKMLHERRISCLPVLDNARNIRGIVTTTDVLRALLTAYELTHKYQTNPESAPKEQKMR